jgi:hypothetical protein
MVGHKEEDEVTKQINDKSKEYRKKEQNQKQQYLSDEYSPNRLSQNGEEVKSDFNNSNKSGASQGANSMDAVDLNNEIQSKSLSPLYIPFYNSL